MGLCLVLMTIWSCQKEPYFIQYADVDGQEWYTEDTVKFRSDTLNINASPRVIVGVRYNDKYKYRKFNLGIKAYEDRRLILTDTIDYEFYSSIGRKQGNGALYKECEAIPYHLNIKQGHRYTFKIYHIMRLNPITGITNLTIRLED